MNPTPKSPAPAKSPSRYKIADLLANSVQPYPGLTDEELRRLADDIDRRGLLNPVRLSREGRLYDGNQRLLALSRLLGKTYISAKDVVIDKDVNEANIWERAIQINDTRRHNTVEIRGHAAARMMRENGWSQVRVAEAFRVHRQSVQQWLKAIDYEGVPAMVEGADGKLYPSRRAEPEAETVETEPEPTPPEPAPARRKVTTTVDLPKWNVPGGDAIIRATHWLKLSSEVLNDIHGIAIDLRDEEDLADLRRFVVKRLAPTTGRLTEAIAGLLKAIDEGPSEHAVPIVDTITGSDEGAEI